jgi:hypothetical protein
VIGHVLRRQLFLHKRGRRRKGKRRRRRRKRRGVRRVRHQIALAISADAT